MSFGKNTLELKVAIDLLPYQASLAKHCTAIYFAPFWFWHKKAKERIQTKVPEELIEIIRKGGLKKAYRIPRSVLYIGGVDRVLFRHPLHSILENIALGADIIAIQDMSLSGEDNEEMVLHKIAWNRACIDATLDWLRK